MLIGIMNNPQVPLMREFEFVFSNHFDFIDLTLEPPNGLIPESDVGSYRALLKDYGTFAIGHTAYYLPIDSPFSSLRASVRDILIRQFDVFAGLGVDRVTLHLGFSYPHRFFSYQDKLGFWMETLDILNKEATDRKVTLMLENTFNGKESIKMLKDLLRKFPQMGFLLDVGHANLHTLSNTSHQYMRFFKNRLKHVHLSDNFGRSDDLHLPLGAGHIPWQTVLKVIKKTGYDDSFTLEVFSREREFVLTSREILRSLWQSI